MIAVGVIAVGGPQQDGEQAGPSGFHFQAR